MLTWIKRKWWMTRLMYAAIPYNVPMSYFTLDCWRDYFEDGYAPDDALREDMSYWGE